MSQGPQKQDYRTLRTAPLLCCYLELERPILASFTPRENPHILKFHSVALSQTYSSSRKAREHLTMSETTNVQPPFGLKGKDKRFRDTWQPRLTLILSVAALMISAFAILSRDDNGIRKLFDSILHHNRIIIIISNLFVSLIAFVFFAKQTTAEFIIQDKEKFKSLAELPETANIEIYTHNLNNRVTKLVNQFRIHMTLFAFSLVLIYTVIALTTWAQPTDPFPMLSGTEEYRKIGYFPVITNLINLLGALFVQLGFSVLYNKTLEIHKHPTAELKNRPKPDNDDHSRETSEPVTYYSSLYWAIPLLLFVPYTLVFVTLSVTYMGGDDLEVHHFLNIFDLVAGSANGLAMSLLFGRFVSIEQSIGKTRLFKTVFEDIFYPFSSIPYKVLVSFGIIFVLPIYALAQPLFGALKINAFGDPDTFETVVYAVCLVGKICFLHLTYIFVSKRLLHLYLYGLVSKVGNFRELEECFDTRAK